MHYLQPADDEVAAALAAIQAYVADTDRADVDEVQILTAWALAGRNEARRARATLDPRDRGWRS
jgi:hypothetical protein